MKKWSEIKKTRFSPAKAAEIDARARRTLLGLDLRGLRVMAGKTHTEVAAAAGMTQGEVSRLERRDDYLLSTLRRYVEALGGELDIFVRLGDRAGVRCHRCRGIADYDPAGRWAEACWRCGDPLCVGCWDRFGECGH